MADCSAFPVFRKCSLKALPLGLRAQRLPTRVFQPHGLVGFLVNAGPRLDFLCIGQLRSPGILDLRKPGESEFLAASLPTDVTQYYLQFVRFAKVLSQGQAQTSISSLSSPRR